MTAPLVPVEVGCYIVAKREGPDMRCVSHNGRQEPIQGVVVNISPTVIDIVSTLGLPGDMVKWHHIPPRSVDPEWTDPPTPIYVREAARRLICGTHDRDAWVLLGSIVRKPRHALAQQEVR